MKVVIIIPARFNSKRLPGKPLVNIAGEPLIQHVFNRATKVPGINDVMVATDHTRIAEAIERVGGRAIMTPDNLQSGSDRVALVAKDLDCDIVVNLQGDEPLIDTQSVWDAVKMVQEDQSIQVSTLGFPLQNVTDWKNRNVVKLITDVDGRSLYFSRQPIPSFPDGEFRPLPNLFQHIGVYVYRREFLLKFVNLEPSPLEIAEQLEQLRILYYGYTIQVIKAKMQFYGVDTTEDVQKVEQLLKQNR